MQNLKRPYISPYIFFKMQNTISYFCLGTLGEIWLKYFLWQNSAQFIFYIPTIIWKHGLKIFSMLFVTYLPIDPSDNNLESSQCTLDHFWSFSCNLGQQPWSLNHPGSSWLPQQYCTSFSSSPPFAGNRTMPASMSWEHMTHWLHDTCIQSS